MLLILDMRKWPLDESFEIPDFESEDFTIELLNPGHLEEDYDAFINSVDLINRTRSVEWPFHGFTIEENLSDLIQHENENTKRESIAFVVRNISDNKYIGCFYFYPIGHMAEKTAVPPDSADVDVSWWVTKDAYNQDAYEKLFEDIKKYLLKWPFESPWFSNLEIPPGVSSS